MNRETCQMRFCGETTLSLKEGRGNWTKFIVKLVCTNTVLISPFHGNARCSEEDYELLITEIILKRYSDVSLCQSKGLTRLQHIGKLYNDDRH